MAELRCTWDPSTFTATAIYTGESRLVRVRGSGECPSGGFTAELVPGNAGINPDPSELVLDIEETEPEFGTDALTGTQIDSTVEVGSEVRHVVIRALELRIAVEGPA